MGSLSSRYPRHPRPGPGPVMLYGVCDWTRAKRPTVAALIGLPRYTAVILPRIPSADLNNVLVSRHSSFVAAQAYADKLNAREPYPPEREGPTS